MADQKINCFVCGLEFGAKNNIQLCKGDRNSNCIYSVLKKKIFSSIKDIIN